MSSDRKKAPWPYWRGADIYEGDTIVHSTGDVAVVVFMAGHQDPWRAKYSNGETLWLGNQIGDKGQACVLDTKEAA